MLDGGLSVGLLDFLLVGIFVDLREYGVKKKGKGDETLD